MLLSSMSKTTILHYIVFLVVPILFFLHSTPVYSQEDPPIPSSIDDALEEELRYLKAETYVITASRIPENIKKTASSVTVITDKQIRQMGARNLADVMQTVPGMNYFYAWTGIHVPDARSLLNATSSRVLVMINSHPLNENYLGSAFWTYDTMMLDNVKRIEFVRGPGSALYGANAFAGVINIITKEAEDVDGWELIARGGSYDTQQYNFLYGKTYNDLDVVFNFNYFDTHGYNKHVNKDMQTSLDRIFLTNASLAPGRMQGDNETYDAFLSMKYRGFKLEGKYTDRERDMTVGMYPILNNKSIVPTKAYYLTISYQKTLWEGFDFSGKVYRNQYNSFADLQYYPSGTAQLTPIGPVIMPDGVNHRFSSKNNRTGFEMQTTWKMGSSNTAVAGISYEEMKQYDINNKANYLRTRFPLVIIPLPRVYDLTNIQNHNRSVKRNFKAFFFEDIWDIRDNLRLTVGVRYDDYSDFGNSTNPRVGLTWEFAKGYDLKLLYSSAFRAPSFWELYDYLNGDPNLDPEEVDTYQVSLSAEFTPSLSGQLTLFRNWTKNSINMIMEFGNEFYSVKNYGKERTDGLEVEMKYDFGRGTYLAMNYTYKNFIKREFAWMLPRHTGNIMANIRLSKYLNFYASCHVEDGWRRSRGDRRDDMSGYAIVNTTLIAKKFLKGYENLELRGSVYNLFDKDYTSPTDKNQLPEDTPRPGRSFMVEVKYKF